MTKERKIYAAVLGVLLVGLIVDQVILGGNASGPDPAAASAPAPTDTVKIDDVVQQMNKAAATLSDENTLAHRLDRFAEQRSYKLPAVADVFKPDAQWGAAEQSESVQKKPRLIETFQKQHKLTGVMLTAQGGVAMIQSADDASRGGRRTPVRVGQTIGGFKLLSVTDKTASFASGELTTTLTLELPSGAGGSSDNPTPRGPRTRPAMPQLK